MCQNYFSNFHFSKFRLFLHNNSSKSHFWKEIWPPFVHLINSIASRNVWKLLNLSYLQKVAKTFFKNLIYLVKNVRQMIKMGLKSTYRGLFGWTIDNNGGIGWTIGNNGGVKPKKMRLDALIIFVVEWRHKGVYFER